MVAGPNGERIVGVWEDGMARHTGYSADEVKAKIGIEESIKLEQANFKSSLAANHWSFVDYYAPWCIHWYVSFEARSANV
jgi:thiol:disulfide interchange protein